MAADAIGFWGEKALLWNDRGRVKMAIDRGGTMDKMSKRNKREKRTGVSVAEG